MNVFKTSAVTLLAAAIVVCAMAQAPTTPRTGRGPGGGGGAGRMGGGGRGMGNFVQTQDPMKTELSLTEDQVKKIDALNETSMAAMRTQFQGAQTMTPTERQAAMTQVRKSYDTKLAEILKPDQITRYHQIQIQMEGARALLRPEVQSQLGLSSSQKSTLTNIFDTQQKSRQELMQDIRGGGADEQARQEAITKMKALQTDTETKALAVLTPSQKTKFEDMKGKAYAGAQRQPRTPRAKPATKPNPNPATDPGAAPANDNPI